MGIPVRLRGGRLTLEAGAEKKKRAEAPEKVTLGISHRRPAVKDKTVPLNFSGASSRRPLLRSSHRGLAKTSRKKVQRFWRVINLHRLLEERPLGEQRITIKDATLPGSVAGRTLRIARINAERLYGCNLEDGSYALITTDRWRAVRHRKSWPVTDDEEDEGAAMVLAVADATSL